MTPSVGRIVHYVPAAWEDSELPGPFAAIITLVHPDNSVGLAVFEPGMLGGTYHLHQVPNAYGYTPGCWTWPPRAPL